MPPLSEVLDALWKVVLPAAMTTAIVFAMLSRWLPHKSSCVAAAFAIAIGFVAGNHLRGAVEYRIDSEQLLTPVDLGRAFRDSIVPPTEEDAPIPPAPRYWIPWSAGVVLLGGLVARATPAWFAWPLRVSLAALAAVLAVSADLRDAIPWLVPAVSAVIFAEWFVLERLGRSEDDDVAYRTWLIAPPLAGCAAFLAASIVLLHAHSARFVDIVTIMAACLGSLAIVAWLIKADPSGAAPAVAVVLPALMMSGQQDTFSEVPPGSFVLVATAPLAMAPLLATRFRGSRWMPATVLTAFAGVLALGAALAVRAESLSFY